MNPVQRFFHKYFISTIAALTLFLLINLVLVVAIRVVAGRHATAPDLSVSALSAMVSEVNGVIEVEPEVSRVLAENRAWAMLLDDGGAVIWEEQMPEAAEGFALYRQYRYGKIMLTSYCRPVGE